MAIMVKVGDVRTYTTTVTEAGLAAFHGETVHPVYATFALARDSEWTSRLFVLDMRQADEEGIGTFLSIEHKAPAFVGEEITFVAKVLKIRGKELICSVVAKVGNKTVAEGTTGQRLLRRERLAEIMKGN